MKTRIGRIHGGYTLYKPTGVKHGYPNIDFKKQQVTCTVANKEKIYMTVVVDVRSDTVQVKGSVNELADLVMAEEAYIDMFKHQADFFIENEISNADEYYNELSKKDG